MFVYTIQSSRLYGIDKQEMAPCYLSYNEDTNPMTTTQTTTTEELSAPATMTDAEINKAAASVASKSEQGSVTILYSVIATIGTGVLYTVYTYISVIIAGI